MRRSTVLSFPLLLVFPDYKYNRRAVFCRCHDIQNNDNQHYDTLRNNDTQHNKFQHDDTQHNTLHSGKNVMLNVEIKLSVVLLSVVLLSVAAPF
jgi:hypothetical protein